MSNILPPDWSTWPAHLDSNVACRTSLWSGLRLAEVISLNVEQITRRGKVKEVVRVKVKGMENGKKRQRDVVFGSKLRTLLGHFLEERRKIVWCYWYNRGPLFLSPRTNSGAIRLSKRTLEVHWRECQLIAGVKRQDVRTFHDIRRTACNRVWDATEDIHTTQAFMGHKNPQTTWIYLNLDVPIERVGLAIEEAMR